MVESSAATLNSFPLLWIDLGVKIERRLFNPFGLNPFLRRLSNQAGIADFGLTCEIQKPAALNCPLILSGGRNPLWSPFRRQFAFSHKLWYYRLYIQPLFFKLDADCGAHGRCVAKKGKVGGGGKDHFLHLFIC